MQYLYSIDTNRLYAIRSYIYSLQSTRRHILYISSFHLIAVTCVCHLVASVSPAASTCHTADWHIYTLAWRTWLADGKNCLDAVAFTPSLAIAFGVFARARASDTLMA